MRQFLERRTQQEDKKVTQKHEMKLLMDKDIVDAMSREDRKFLKHNAAKLRATFLKDSAPDHRS